ncbi:MAG: hypothetical protein L0Z55_12890 [Planctomycetes bacterium]|nr:hypothetical protein [Planctomycetota bacterium]
MTLPTRRARALIRSLAAAAACLAATSCIGPSGGRFAVEPLLEHTVTAQGDSTLLLRPFVLARTTGGRRDVGVLWPIFRSTSDAEQSRAWLLPVWHRWSYLHESGDRDVDSFLFPLVYWGTDPREGDYFMLFPVAGSLRGIFAQRRIDVALFPLYARVVNDARSSQHVLWPIFNVVSGLTHDGIRFFPFYGRYRARNGRGEPIYDRRFYLWPFFHAQDELLDTENPKRTRWFFPIYGSIDGKNITERSILWPLFVHTRNRPENTTKVSLFPWTFGWGKDYEQFDVWPLYGRRRTATSFRQFLLWPVQQYERQTAGSRINESLWVLPIYWHHSRTDLAADNYESRTRFWPFCSIRRADRNRLEVNALDLLPFDDADYFEPLYARLWRVYRYERSGADGDRTWDLMWGLVRSERLGARHRVSILGGFLERTTEPDDTQWRILYIPF